VGDTVTLSINGSAYSGVVLAGKVFAIDVAGSDLAADNYHTIDASITTIDGAGNSASASDSEGYTVDASIPAVTVDIVDASLNVADNTSQVTFTFTQAPVGFDAGDISVAGGTLSGLTATGNPLVYTATFTATAGSEAPG